MQKFGFRAPGAGPGFKSVRGLRGLVARGRERFSDHECSNNTCMHMYIYMHILFGRLSVSYEGLESPRKFLRCSSGVAESNATGRPLL